MKLQDAFKKGTVVHCATYKEAKRIVKEINKLRFEWKLWGKETCYDIYNGFCGYIGFYKNRNYTIIPSTEIETSHESTEIENEEVDREDIIYEMIRKAIEEYWEEKSVAKNERELQKYSLDNVAEFTAWFVANKILKPNNK